MSGIVAKFDDIDLKNQIGSLLVLLALSIDSCNPVKAVSGFIGMEPFYWGFFFLTGLVIVLWQHLADVIYFCITIFFQSINSIFFKSIDIVGAENIPKDGPVLFVGNHANQFVDGMMVLMNCRRKVGFLVAEKSFHRPIIGTLSRAMGCIPVIRPQDSVKKGNGLVMMASNDEKNEDKFVLLGYDTKFTSQIKPGDQVRIQGDNVAQSGSPVQVLEVVDDLKLILAAPLKDKEGITMDETKQQFGIFKKVDQSQTFSEVYQHLKRSKCIGIFPEGGSHDRTDLLPLKAGVSIMAFGVKEKYHINATVIPVGLNYFRGHRFRGRVVIEFGSPIVVDDDLMKSYRQDKRSACNEFLHRIEEGMRSVLVTAPDYHILQLVYTARRLFQPSGVRLSPSEKQDLNRRFAEGYKLLSTDEEVSKELTSLEAKVLEYQQTIRSMGLQDHQVPYISWWNFHDVLASAVYSLFVFLLASIPTFFLNAPVGLLARYVARVEQKKALAGSKVKIAARDVMLSKKISFSLIAVPTLWISYLIVAVLFTDWYWSSILLMFVSFPLFSYFGVRSVEAGIIEFKSSIRPLFYRFYAKDRKIFDELPRKRVQLQHEIRNFVKKYKEKLGVIGDPHQIDWFAFMHEQNETERLSSDDTNAVAAKSTSPSVESPSVESSSTGLESSPTLSRRNTITQFHDLSYLQKKTNSSIDLAGLVPPIIEEKKPLTSPSKEKMASKKLI